MLWVDRMRSLVSHKSCPSRSSKLQLSYVIMCPSHDTAKIYANSQLFDSLIWNKRKRLFENIVCLPDSRWQVHSACCSSLILNCIWPWRFVCQTSNFVLVCLLQRISIFTYWCNSIDIRPQFILGLEVKRIEAWCRKRFRFVLLSLALRWQERFVMAQKVHNRNHFIFTSKGSSL
jgi:hypothetical protein